MALHRNAIYQEEATVAKTSSSDISPRHLHETFFRKWRIRKKGFLSWRAKKLSFFLLCLLLYFLWRLAPRISKSRHARIPRRLLERLGIARNKTSRYGQYRNRASCGISRYISLRTSKRWYQPSWRVANGDSSDSDIHYPISVALYAVKLFRSPIRWKQCDNKIAIRVRFACIPVLSRFKSRKKYLFASGRFQFSFRERARARGRERKRESGAASSTRCKETGRAYERARLSSSLDILSFPSTLT